MARHVVVLALVLFTVVQAYAADKSNVAPVTNSDADLSEPPTGGVIGVLEAADAPSIVSAAPIGGPVPPGAYDSANGPASSDASKLQFSTTVGAAALVGFFYF